MVLDVKPAKFLENDPESTTGLLAESITPMPPITGFGEVLNTKPLAVIGENPLETIWPEMVLELEVRFDELPVLTVGADGRITSISSKATPSFCPLPSVPNLNLTLTLAWPAAPSKGVTDVNQPVI